MSCNHSSRGFLARIEEKMREPLVKVEGDVYTHRAKRRRTLTRVAQPDISDSIVRKKSRKEGAACKFATTLRQEKEESRGSRDT